MIDTEDQMNRFECISFYIQCIFSNFPFQDPIKKNIHDDPLNYIEINKTVGSVPISRIICLMSTRKIDNKALAGDV